MKAYLKRMTRMCAVVACVGLAVVSWGQQSPAAGQTKGKGKGAAKGKARQSGPRAQANLQTYTTLDSAYAVVVLPDLQGLIDRLAPITSGLFPGKGEAAELKADWGENFGDPAMQGMPVGKGMAIVVFPGPYMAHFIEVTPEKMPAYLQHLNANGRGIVYEEAAGLLVNPMAHHWNTPDAAQQTGKAVAAQVKQLCFSAATREPNVRATVFVKRIVDQYDGQVQMLIGGMPMMMAMGQANMRGRGGAPADPAAIQQAARMLEAELRGLYAVARQVDRVDAQLEFPDGAIRFVETVHPVAGSNLETFLKAPAPAGNDLSHYLPGTGAMRMMWSVNMEAAMEFFTREANAVMAQMNIAEPQRGNLLKFFKDSRAMQGDLMAFEMLLPQSATMFDGAFVGRVKDAAVALDCLKNMEKNMQATGMADLYTTMGTPITMKFTEKVREHGGVAIHQLDMDLAMAIEIKTAPAEQTALMKQMMGDMKYEVAFVGNTIVYAMGSQKIETLIDAVKAGKALSGEPPKPLAAQTTFGPGGAMYMDFDLGRMLGVMAPMIDQNINQARNRAMAARGAKGGAAPPDPLNPVAALASALQGGGPIAMSAFIANGQAHGGVVIPAGVIQGFGQFTRTMQEQARARRQGVPSRTEPDGAPAAPAGF